MTIAFSILSIQGRITAQEFLTIFSVVIAFYFGTQSQRLYDNDTTSKGKS